MSDDRGRPVPLPSGINGKAVAKRLQEQHRKMAEKGALQIRAYEMLEESWRVIVSALRHKDARLILFRVEEALQQVTKRHKLPVRAPLNASELRLVSEYFARRTETAWEVVKPGKSRPLRTDKRAKRR